MFEYQAKILTVHDGDTCRADIDLGFGVSLKNQSLRVFGIDTPETSTDAGKLAREHARTLLTGGLIVRVETFKDSKEKYGRYLTKIRLPDGSDYGSAMIAAGHAKPYFGGTKEP
jgi:micrococcal nuclease